MELTPEPGFVIALCVMDRAIPIPQPRSALLNRYRFFLTRRSTGGREFYVLHMGTFATAAEAEKWLNILRVTYPNAYISETVEPGEPLPTPLSDTQVLRVLEVRPPKPAPAPAAAPAPARESGGMRIEESLRDLAERESPTGMYESLSTTGVRHLSIEVAKPTRKPGSRFR